jgi:hypothetical protein
VVLAEDRALTLRVAEVMPAAKAGEPSGGWPLAACEDERSTSPSLCDYVGEAAAG